MAECTHNCDTCGEKCGKESFYLKPKSTTKIGKMIGVVSGKGGVGKSTVTSILAVNMARKGYRTAILDADVTGPSIPRAFGITEKAYGNSDGTTIYPAVSATGIKIMSMNLLLDDEGEPVVWRGPVISGAVKQFYTDVEWEEVDYMFVDMPPGTGDVPLTAFQSLPLDAIIVVTTPQELVSMIVGKAVKMAEMMDIKVLGLVENMSYIECPHCKEKIYPYGKSRANEAAKEFSVALIGGLPIDARLSESADEGRIEFIGEYLAEATEAVERLGRVKTDD